MGLLGCQNFSRVAFQRIAPGVYQLSDNGVNVFLVECHGLTLIDTGLPTTGEKIIQGLQALGHDPCTLARILLTHCHPDHAGSAAYLKEALGAQILCHPYAASLLTRGETNTETLSPSPGLLNKLLYQAFVAGAPSDIVPAEADRFLQEGEEVIGGFRTIHTPGHSPGHIAFLWNGLLFAGDSCANVGWLRAPIVAEDYQQTLRSIQKLSILDFHSACFGHGSPIIGRAHKRFRGRIWWQPQAAKQETRQVLWRRE